MEYLEKKREKCRKAIERSEELKDSYLEKLVPIYKTKKEFLSENDIQLNEEVSHSKQGALNFLDSQINYYESEIKKFDDVSSGLEEIIETINKLILIKTEN